MRKVVQGYTTVHVAEFEWVNLQHQKEKERHLGEILHQAFEDKLGLRL